MTRTATASIGINGIFYLFGFHAEGNTDDLVNLRADINGNCTAQDQRIDDTFMDIPRQDDFIAGLAD